MAGDLSLMMPSQTMAPAENNEQFLFITPAL
jgi:hypothetical protein